MMIFNLRRAQCCDGRVVKASDLKSDGQCPRRFEPCSQRIFLQVLDLLLLQKTWPLETVAVVRYFRSQHTVCCTLYKLHCVIYSVRCTLYTVYYTRHTRSWENPSYLGTSCSKMDFRQPMTYLALHVTALWQSASSMLTYEVVRQSELTGLTSSLWQQAHDQWNILALAYEHSPFIDLQAFTEVQSF